MSRRARLGWRLLLVWVLLSFDGAAQSLRFSADVQVVEVPVVVYDRRTARAVTGLTLDDFELFEEGRPQKILTLSTFQRLRTGQVPHPSDLGDGIPGFRSNRAVLPESAGTVVTVLIDALNARPEDCVAASRGIAQALAEWRDARVGVFVLERPGVRVLHDYDGSRESLPHTLETYQCSAGEPSTAMADRAEFSTFELHRARMRTTLQGLETLALHLSDLPGRKPLLWISPGIDLKPLLESDPQLMARVVQRINQSNVAVYSLDPGGPRPVPGFTADLGATHGMAGTRSYRARQELTWLKVIAEATGGTWFADHHDLARGLLNAVRDASEGYVLTYAPERTHAPGRFVEIDVKVKRPHVQVRHRSGYFTLGKPTAKKVNAEQEMTAVLHSPMDAAALSIRARVSPVGEFEGESIELTAWLGGAQLALKPAGGRWRGSLLWRYVQRSSNGASLDEVQDEMDLNLSEAQYRQVLTDGLLWRRKIAFKPQTDNVRVLVLDQNSGMLGSLTVPVRAPDAAEAAAAARK